jgi:ectoine hydroxylase-related dioxygenase (phytanoyl-CoA dioxygenase family)
MKKNKIDFLIEKLNSNGYFVIKNFINKKLIESLLMDLSLLFAKETKDVTLDLNWSNRPINQIALRLRKLNPEVFSKIYNSIKNNPKLLNLVNCKKIINLAAKILKTKKHFLWNGEFMLRMDAPKDKRNILGWHQEAHYYKKQTTDGSNGIVMWIALGNKINKKMGALQACPGSHKCGLINIKKVKQLRTNKIDKKFKSTTYMADTKFIKEYKFKTIETVRGDLIVMDLRTFHRSGNNNSNLFRLSTVSRIFNINSKSWPI